MESCFLPTNNEIDLTITARTWGRLPDPGYDVDAASSTTFVQGLKVLGGHGDATLKEGLAIYQYAFDTNMEREAFTTHDGELLIIPQDGALDVLTEMGMLRLRPGMIGVVPPGIRFAVSNASIATGHLSAYGYALEVYGTSFRLPDLGVLGANGLAHVRDFEYPVANSDPFDSDDAGQWRITVKLAGRLQSYHQKNTPFDVVAWHGKYAPYRYNLAHFCHLTANKDQLDPTAFAVLTAPSRWPGISLVDFCVFGEKWLVAKDTLRIPYYHRTMATELCGVIRGEYRGTGKTLVPGGLSMDQSYTPHGESFEAYVRAVNAKREDMGPVKAGEGYLGQCFLLGPSWV